MSARLYMRKCKYLLGTLLALALLLCAACALAADADPIVCSIEVDPAKLSAPGKVNVTITIANSGETDMKDPVTLHDPATQIVSDFGTNGSVTLKAGESKTWTGVYDVSQRMLNSGTIIYYAQYTLYGESGEAKAQSQPIRASIQPQTAEADITVKRTITPTAAREGQEIVVKYEILNSGTVNLTNIKIKENKDIYSKTQTIKELKPGQTAEIKYPVTMAKKDLTSGATITYQSEASKKEQTYTVENFKIVYGESSLAATLKSSSKGVPINEKITLTLTLENKGSVALSDIRVTDPTLGDVFTNQEVAAGKTLELQKEITLPSTMEYAFTVTAMDATGTELTVAADPVTITAVNPEDVLSLTVTATPDKTEVYETPGIVRFTIDVANTSNVAASNVVVRHGENKLYTFEMIPAGETRRLTRDTALSMAGKYRFTVTAQDPLENNLTAESNEIQIAFSVPTPAPATATPPPVPTEEPTFSPATMPPISDRSIGAVPKTVQGVLLPVLIVAALGLVASVVLLIIATMRRAEQRKAAEAALDHLERAKRRDYVTPAEEPEPENEEPEEPTTVVPDEDLPDYDLPPVSAVEKARAEDALYDEEMRSDFDQYDQPADEPYESDGYTDGFPQDDGELPPYDADDDGDYVDGHAPDDRDAPYEDEPRDGDVPDASAATGRAARRSRAERNVPTDL